MFHSARITPLIPRRAELWAVCVYHWRRTAMNRLLKSSRPLVCGLKLALLFCSGVLAGCATFSADGGFDRVADTTRTELGKNLTWPRTAAERAKRDAEVAGLLAHPLGVEDAVQLALLNNHALQASFEQLGISEADLVQSGRLPNPRFTLRDSSADGLYDIEQTLTFNVLALITYPYAHATEKRRFAEVQDATVVAVVQLADRTRTAYFTALAARDSLHYAWQVKDAAETSAELAHRMLGAGNWNRLDQARQQGFYVEAMQALARAQLADARARAELDAVLGIADARQDVQLAAQLPDLPTNIVSLPDIETTALNRRIDLKMMRTELDELARRLRLTAATRFVNVLDGGATRVRQGTRDSPFEHGYEVSLEIPIFDTGAARVRKAEARYAQAAERFSQAAIEARSEVRKAAEAYRVAYEMAVREHEEFIPLHKQIIKQDVLRYNASLISVFELLADARAEISGVDDYIQSVRDFWIARSHLDTAMLAAAAP
jgi:outer membrane protein TolC